MDINAYADGLISILKGAGVEDAELDEAKIATETIPHLFMKGVSFERAARALCKKFDIEITE